MSSMSSPPNYHEREAPEHLDEMTCMLYLERQLERTRALEVSAHTQDCAICRTLLRAMDRESRLLTRAMLEEEEPLPARIAAFQNACTAPCNGSGWWCLDSQPPPCTPCTPVISSRGNNASNKPDSGGQVC